MRNYWSCSAFADWLRATKKPSFATAEEWRDWGETAKRNHPIRYWLADDGLDMLDKAFHWVPEKIHSVRYYVNNRWIDRTHYLRTGLEPGKWHEFDTRLLHGMFEELVDFVEVESAWHHVVWDKEARKKFGTPWWRKWYRLWRSPEAGIAHLEWAASLVADESWGMSTGDKNYGKPTSQADTAKETLRLYNWWKNVRPHRPDVYDVTGWTAYCESRRREEGSFFAEDKTAAQRKNTHRMLKNIRKLEEQHNREDTEMMIALIKIRHSLWT